MISGQRYDKIPLISLFDGCFLTGRGEEVGEEEGGIGGGKEVEGIEKRGVVWIYEQTQLVEETQKKGRGS